MVVRTRLVAACHDGARGIILLDDLCQMLRQERLHAELTVLGQRRGVMACIQNEVGLFQCERVSFCRRPLLQHLVAYRPHQNGWMIAVAEDEVGEVTLMPLIEEAGIVVLRLLAAPHIETLVHNDQSHRVAHVQQFRGWRVVRATDSVHAHRLEFRKFAMQGVLIEGCAQAAEIVMLADAVQFEILTVEPESSLRIELETAEACRGLVGIHHLATLFHYGTYLINIRGLTTPEHGLADGDTRFQSFRLSDNLTIRGYQCILHLALAFERNLDSESALAFHHTGIGEDAPVTDVGASSRRKPHMAVDTAARVPSGIGLITVIDLHSHHVVALTDIRCDVVLET